MTKCTNNHTGPLNIGGVTIAAGKSGVLDDAQLKAAKASNAVKVWEKLELISFEEEKKAEPKKKAPAKKAAAAKEPAAPAAPAVPGVPSAS